MQTSGRATRRTIPNVTDPVLRIAHLYADEMNIYGDRGNILTLQRRAEWRGIPVEVRAVGRGPAPDLSDIDLIFWGGGQDRDQELVFTDAAAHKVQAIRAAIDDGAAIDRRTDCLDFVGSRVGEDQLLIAVLATAPEDEVDIG